MAQSICENSILGQKLIGDNWRRCGSCLRWKKIGEILRHMKEGAYDNDLKRPQPPTITPLCLTSIYSRTWEQPAEVLSIVWTERTQLFSICKVYTMPESSSTFLELLPPKTYIPPPHTKARQAQLTSSPPLIDAPVGDQVMPTEDMIRAQVSATKGRSSSTTSTVSSLSSNSDAEQTAFLPLAELEE